MSKPAWMDKAEQEARQSERIAPGGHRCLIKMIESVKSKSGLDMYVIYFDTTDDDTQPQYFKKKFDADTRDGKSWGGRMWLIVDENANSKTENGVSYYGQKNLAKFTTAIEDSNDGFQIDWTAKYTTPEFCKQFAGKKVGIVFGEEEYTTFDHQIRIGVKPKYLRKFDKVLEAKIPPLKELPPKPQAWSAPDSNGFMQLADDLDDEGLPFNV